MDIKDTLRRKAKAAGSQKALADSLGVSNSYLSEVLAGRKEPGQKLLEPLGIERVVSYRRKP